ncbi:AraC family transcriptional regulator [Gordonia terrae]|uniref:helix-turn-helix domain-containing protein n=1 Tax=Gordonia hongkongensis TaxID=1701090 RepID=UPI0022C956A3|nr:AraC family transcriptional regulator [Gordonia terrae]
MAGSRLPAMTVAEPLTRDDVEFEPHQSDDPLDDTSVAGTDGTKFTHRACANPRPQSLSDVDAGAGSLTFVVVLEGELQIRATTRVTYVKPDEIAVVQRSGSVSVASTGPYRAAFLSIPRDAADVPFDIPGCLVVPGEHALAQSFSSLMSVINECGASLGLFARRRAVRSAADLGAAILHQEAGPSVAVTPKATMLQAMCAYIEEHLGERTLDVNQLARVHHVSIRHVHKIFRDGHESAAAHIRRRRIARARQDLADPAQEAVPVSVIAARWGFSSASHFGHLFKSVVGCTPATYREITLGSSS